MNLETTGLEDCFGLGVAGNFAGHLEQAGEAADFAGVGEAKTEAPKGIFPFYVPGDHGFLGAYPLSHDRIAFPQTPAEPNIQIEPEAGLLCDVDYAVDGTVAALRPVAIAAFNDCSIRRPDAKKISEKKNWGADSKGVARSLIAVTDLDPEGPTKSLRIACFLCRDGETQAYGIDSPVVGYSYYGQQLLDWMAERINHQTGGADSPLEPIAELLRSAGNPRRVLIGIGATRYTDLGSSTFLRPGDESIVVVYDGDELDQQALAAAIAARRDADLGGASVLRQLVYAA